MRPSLFLFALVLAPTLAVAQPNLPPAPACPVPTPAQCRATAYYATPCGRIAGQQALADPNSTCALYVREAADQLGQTTGQIQPVADTLPAQMAGGGTPVLTIPLDQMRNHTTYQGAPVDALDIALGNESKAVSRSSYLFLPVDFLPDLQPPSPVVTSCKVYVRTKWWDWSRFEEITGTYGKSYRAIYDRAYDPVKGIAYKPIRSLDGTVQTTLDWPTAPIPKNPYYLFELTPFDRVAFDPTTIPEAAGRAFYTASWSWNQNMSTDLAAWGYTDAELEDEQARQRTFKKLLASRAKLLETLKGMAYGGFDVVDSLTHVDLTTLSDFGTWGPSVVATDVAGTPMVLADAVAAGATVPPGTVPPDYGGYSGAMGQLHALDVQIAALLQQAHDNGCLVLGITSLCDWAPSVFVDYMKDRFLSEREADMSRCMADTGNDFTATAMIHHAITAGISTTRNSYTPSSTLVTTYLDLYETWLAALPITVAPGSTESPLGNWMFDSKFTPGDKFAVGYDYMIGYGLKKSSTASTSPDTAQCDTDVGIGATFHATAKVMGKDYYLIDSENVAESRDTLFHLDLHTKILTYSLYEVGPIDSAMDIALIDKKATLGGEASLSIPVGPFVVKVTGGLVGEAGVKVTLSGSINRVCTLGSTAHFRITAAGNLHPWLSAEATASASVGIEGLIEAGVKGSVNLLKLDLPLTAELKLEPAVGNDVRTMLATLTGKLTGNLSSLDGWFAVFVKVPIAKPYTKKFFEWTGFAEPIAFDKSWTLPVSSLFSRL